MALEPLFRLPGTVWQDAIRNGSWCPRLKVRKYIKSLLTWLFLKESKAQFIAKAAENLDKERTEDNCEKERRLFKDVTKVRHINVFFS